MIGLIASVVYTVCTNCVGVGSVDVVCPQCSGKGCFVSSQRTKMNSQNVRSYMARSVVPCKGCSKGLLRAGDKGSGKVRKSCPVCKGQKKIKSLAQ